MPSFESKIPKPVNDVTQSPFADKKPEPLLPDIMEEEKLSAAKDNDAEQQQFSNEPGAEQKPEQHALAGENAETDPDMQWQRGIAAKIKQARENDPNMQWRRGIEVKIQQARENDPNMQWRRDLEAKIEESNQNDPNMQWRRGIEAKIIESNQNDPNMQWRRGIEAKLEARSKAQLSVSQPDEPRELEADKKSEEVTSPPGPLSKFERGSDARYEDTVAAKSSSGGELAVDRETKDYINNLPAGQSLPLKIKNFFQTRFGRSFNKVKIHNDRQANEAAAAINAKAFTKGNDIVFGEGQYQPDTIDGKKLIAHELTHVAQQGMSGNQSVQRLTGYDVVPPDQQKDFFILRPPEEKIPDFKNKYDELVYYIQKGDVQYCSHLLKRLNDNEANYVLANPIFMKMAVDCFDNAGIMTLLKEMKGNKFLKVKWINEEGLNWDDEQTFVKCILKDSSINEVYKILLQLNENSRDGVGYYYLKSLSTDQIKAFLNDRGNGRRLIFLILNEMMTGLDEKRENKLRDEIMSLVTDEDLQTVDKEKKAVERGARKKVEVITFFEGSVDIAGTILKGGAQGHTAIAIGDNLYSFSLSFDSVGWQPVESKHTYLQKNNYRSGIGHVIEIPEKDVETLKRSLDMSVGKGIYFKNEETCATQVALMLQMIFRDISKIDDPQKFVAEIEAKLPITDRRIYPAKNIKK